MRIQPVVRPQFPSPETSLRSSTSHFLLGWWPQRGSCLERAGDIWGDGMEIGFKFNLLTNLSVDAVLGALKGQGCRGLRGWAVPEGEKLWNYCSASTQNVLPTSPETGNKCYLFQVNASFWGLIWGCNFYVGWKIFLLFSVAVTDMRMPSLQICWLSERH